MLFVDIKVSLDQIQRRFTLPAAQPPSWHDLSQLIRQRFDLPEETHRFTVGLVYKDNEGEDLTISSDVELAEIWPTVTDDDERELDALPPLRFTLINIPAVPSTPSISSSTPTLASEILGGPASAPGEGDDQTMENDPEVMPSPDDERSSLRKDVKAFVDIVKKTVAENKEVKEAFEKVQKHAQQGKQPDGDDDNALPSMLSEQTGSLDALTSGIVAALLTPALLGSHAPPPPPPHQGAPFPFPFPPFHGPPHHRRGSGGRGGGKHEHPPPPPPGAFPMMGFMMPPPPPPHDHRGGPPHHSPHHGPPHHPPHHGPPHHPPPPPHHHTGPPPHHHPGPPPHHHPGPPPHHSWWPGFGPFGRGLPFLPPHLQHMMGYGGGGFPGFGGGSGSASASGSHRGFKREHRHGKKGRRNTVDIASSDDDLSFSEDKPSEMNDDRHRPGTSSESGSESEEVDRPRAPRRKAHRPTPHHEHGHGRSPGHEGGRRSHPPPPTHDGPPNHHPGRSSPPPPCPRHGHEGKHGHGGPPPPPPGHHGRQSPPPSSHGKHARHPRRH